MGPMHFVFCRLYPFSPSHHGSVWVLYLSFLLNNTVSPMRAWLIIWSAKNPILQQAGALTTYLHLYRNLSRPYPTHLSAHGHRSKRDLREKYPVWPGIRREPCSHSGSSPMSRQRKGFDALRLKFRILGPSFARKYLPIIVIFCTA